MYIAKDFTFEMAHKLKENCSYSTKCQNIHGHSYKANVGLSFRTTPTLDKYGMVIDFGLVSASFKDFFNKLDHSLMIWQDDELFTFIGERLKSFNQKLCVSSFNPTSEHLALAILQNLNLLCIKNFENVKVEFVKINETCTSEAFAEFKDLSVLGKNFDIEFIAGR